MSRSPIWSLNARRSELGHARKWQIYTFKAATGLAIALALAIALDFALYPTGIASLAVFVTSKVCWYLNTKQKPDGWSFLDWHVDFSLHFLWLALLFCWRGEYVTAAVILAGLIFYPWSSE